MASAWTTVFARLYDSTGAERSEWFSYELRA